MKVSCVCQPSVCVFEQHVDLPDDPAKEASIQGLGQSITSIIGTTDVLQTQDFVACNKYKTISAQL